MRVPRRAVLASGAALVAAPARAGDMRPTPDEVMGYLMGVTAVSRRAKAEGMVDYGRTAGSKYDALASAYVEAAFRRFGLTEVRQEAFPIPQAHWTLRRIALEYLGPGAPTRLLSAFTSHEARLTGAAGVETEVVDIGRGSAAEIAGRDLAGKTALVHGHAEGIVFGHSAQGVVSRLMAEGKVAGVIVAVHQPGDPQTRYSVIPSSPGIDGGRGLDRLYWTNISGADGNTLAGLIRDAGGRGRIRMTIEGTHEPGWVSQNTIGVAQGQTPETVLLLAHTDSHFQGATDNASGVAALLALGRYFARRLHQRTFVLVASGGHHSGPSGGVRELIRRHPGLIDRTVMVVNLEHFGSRGPDGAGGLTPGPSATNLFVPAQNPAIVAAIRKAAAANGVALGGEVRPYWSADYAPFLRIGTPAAMIMQPTFWYHTEADTPDKIDPEGLAGVVRTWADTLEALDSVPAAEIAVGTPTTDLLRDLMARRARGG